MTSHIPHALDSLVVAITSITVAASSVILTEAPQSTVERLDLMVLLLPLIGAMIVSGGLIMLNPQTETRKITIGRAIFSLLGGSLAPSLVAMFMPSLAAYNVKPVFLLAVGALISGIFFILIRSVTEQAFGRAQRVAKELVDRAEARIPGMDKPPAD